MGKTGRKNKNYTQEFKKEAVERYLSGELGGVRIASRKLGLRSKTQLQQWVKQYKEDPELLKQDGRKLGKKDGVQKGRPKQKDLDAMTKDEQIEYLKMEVAVLKKAKALRKNYGEH